MAATLNDAAYRHARQLIEAGRSVLDDRAAWSEHQPSARRENAFIEEHGGAEYGRWRLGVDPEVPQGRKARYRFPYGDFTAVHRCGVLSAEVRAAQQHYFDIETAVAHLHGMLDALRMLSSVTQAQVNLPFITADASGPKHLTATVNVSARDKDTGAEQQITVAESGTLDKGEVERMVREAEQHRAADQQARQEIDARNELDSVAHQVQRRLDELGDQVPEHERARAGMLVQEARQAVDGKAPMDRVQNLTNDLRQILFALESTAQQAGGGQAAGQGQEAGQAAGRSGRSTPADDVIDADFSGG
ncbi:Hsp70 family protein [Dactylosporangium sp. NBC_01737]|uniref:Hsp70 family protein n=1 Tax=Dactylosporangium sp. NBC_01737 TaxID=2975959 RepID=UPI002E12DEF1|nr:Hsp70 family protein [Dactylosporangium sp. NBC_01737]